MVSPDRHGLLVAPLERGFLWQETGQAPLALITETELLGGKVRSKRAREEQKLKLRCGDQKPGRADPGPAGGASGSRVGRYLGLETIDAGGLPTEF